MAGYNYVTLFNLNYLNRGLVMYESLRAVDKDATLYVVCFDESSYHILNTLNYDGLVPVSLKDFEDEELLKVKPTRTATEYCWTCSASVIWYCMHRYKLTNCAYVDADMFFYSNPAKIWDENANASVFITLHNYSPDYDQSAISGKFCVQFVGFKNAPDAMEVLLEWRKDCIRWCYNRVEDGKFGDQKYLDEWPSKYPMLVHVVKNIAAGLAPWNVQQFAITSPNKVIQKAVQQELVPIFFHFHKLKIHAAQTVSLTSAYYKLDKRTIDTFYLPYAKKLLETDRNLLHQFPEAYKIVYTDSQPVKFNLLKWLKYYFYYLKQNIKNIDPEKANEKFRSDYLYKIN